MKISERNLIGNIMLFCADSSCKSRYLRIKIKGYLEDFALSRKEADELVMSAREIAYKD